MSSLKLLTPSRFPKYAIIEIDNRLDEELIELEYETGFEFYNEGVISHLIWGISSLNHLHCCVEEYLAILLRDQFDNVLTDKTQLVFKHLRIYAAEIAKACIHAQLYRDNDLPYMLYRRFSDGLCLIRRDCLYERLKNEFQDETLSQVFSPRR